MSPIEYDFRGRRVSPKVQPKKIKTSHELPGRRKFPEAKTVEKPRAPAYTPGKYSSRDKKDDPPKVSVKELNGFGSSPADAYK